MKKEKKIDVELLKRFFNKQCTEAEQENVVNWFVDEAYEQKLSFLLKKYWDELDYQQNDLNEATERILNKIHIQIEEESKTSAKKNADATEPEKKNKVKYINVFKYAAMIAILISTGFVFYYSSFSEKAISAKVIKEIKPGSEKATLILANGTEVNLEEKEGNVSIFNASTEIVNKDKVLSYKTNVINSENAEELVSDELKYNTLKVPAGGIYQILLEDGTKVWLNAASSLKYPVTFNTSSQRIVELTGEGYFDVAKNGKKFIVKTSQVDITVLGTEFNVSSYAEDEFIATTLVEGSVVLSNNYNSIELKPNDQGILKIDSDKFEVKKVDVNLFTSWRTGKFYFEKQKLKDLLKIVGRWYDVQIVIESPILEEKLFTGVINKNESFDFLLKMISQSLNIEYELNKNEENNQYELRVLKK